MKVKLNDGRKGTVVEELDNGVSVLLDRKGDKNYKKHKTEYVVYAKEGTYEVRDR
jgi:hypothetical protein